MTPQAALPDIPRLYTAAAEWAACLVYVLILKKRFGGARLAGSAAAGLALLAGIQSLAGMLPLALWVPGMAAAVAAMFGIIFLCSGAGLRDSWYCCTGAFILAEFAASLSWQLYCYFFRTGKSAVTPGGAFFTLAVYAAVFALMYFFELRHIEQGGKLSVLSGELWPVTAIALGTFLISNISFVTVNTPFSSRIVPELLYIRTLVDFGGLVILYTHQEQRRENRLRSELRAMQSILRLQFAQYEQSRESIDLINRKYHDLKHQIAVIRAEKDPAKRAAYLDEIENGIRLYEAQNKTGNGVLDTVLATKSMICQRNGITLTCVANGALLDFMDVMDICSIFGNALDNAIESAVKIASPERRLVRVALYSQNRFVLICFENCFEGELRLEGGLPATTKSGTGWHGFGLKSIRHTAEKYGGSMTVNTEDGWFILRILLPAQKAALPRT